MTNLKMGFTALLLTAVASNNWALEPSRTIDSKPLAFADSALECGVYYEYTASALEMNQNVDREVVHSITQNSQTLLHTADLLYQAAGISIADRRKEFMRKAKSMIKEGQESPRSIDELIFDVGEKCKRLMASYSYRIKNIMVQPNSI